MSAELLQIGDNSFNIVKIAVNQEYTVQGIKETLSIQITTDKTLEEVKAIFSDKEKLSEMKVVKDDTKTVAYSEYVYLDGTIIVQSVDNGTNYSMKLLKDDSKTTQKQLDDTQKQLEDTKKNLSDAKAQLEDTNSKVEEYKETIDNLKNSLQITQAALNTVMLS